MKAYNYRCICGLEGDRIVEKNEVVKCSCQEVMERVGGPIGGEDILPEPPDPSIKVGFVKFHSKTLNREIKNKVEMKAAFEEMYSVKIPEPVEVKPLMSKFENVEAVEEETPVATSPRRGRPKKVVEEAAA